MIINTQTTNSFYSKIRISLGLMAVIPILLVTLLVIYDKLTTINTGFLLCGLIVASVLIGFNLLKKSADQLQSLAQETKTVGSTEALPTINVQVDGELQDIANNFNTLLTRLNSANRDIRDQSTQLLKYTHDLAISYEMIKQEEELRNHLCRYISSDLVGNLLESNNGNLLSNQRKPVTVMFADIRSFTSLAEYMEPEDLVSMLNEYFTIMVDIVFTHDGMLDKLAGDQLMAVFGHISDERQGANDAVIAAINMHEAVKKLMEKRSSENLPTFEIGIGINTGTAVFAHVGSENRMDYTVIGDTINAAARLEKHAKGGEIIIGEKTRNHLIQSLHVGNRAKLEVKNRSKPVVCYTVSHGRKSCRGRA